MPRKQKKSKLKTHRATAARFGVTGSGKLVHLKGRRSHLRRKKDAKTKRQFGQKIAVAKADVARVKALIGDGM